MKLKKAKYVKDQIIAPKYYLIFLLLLSSTSCTFSQQNIQDKISERHSEKETDAIISIDITTINEQVIGKDVQFVDIRTTKEYNVGYIDDAINISIADKEKFNSRFQQLDKEKPVYIYCYSGWRSHRAAKLLVTIGFQKVYDFTGGYKAWSER